MPTAVTLKPGRVEQLPIGKLAPDPEQPRKSIDAAALAALADNIKARGILQPILVRAGKKGLVIVDGERRWRAAKLARLKVVPAMMHVAGTTEVELRVDQVAANNLRQALTSMDLARFLRQLRDGQKMSPNEIAVTLEKHGMKALTRKEIEAQLLLTDLADWAQRMIDDGTLDQAAAPALLKGAKYPAIEKDFRRRIEQRQGWAGRVIAREAESSLAAAMREQYSDLGRVAEYYDDAVRFDHRKRCKGCEHYATGSNFAVCTDKKLFKAHNDDAKAAGLGPGGKRPEPKPLAEARQEKAKVEQREQSIERTAAEYLTRYILRRLDEVLDIDQDLCCSLVLWAAAWRPGGAYCDRTPQRIIEMFGRARAEEHRARWDSLAAFLIPKDAVPRTPWDLAVVQAARLIARQVKDCLDFTHLVLLAQHVWGPDLGTFWKMDSFFPKLFRKGELAHQLRACGAELPEGRKSWDAMKTSELQTELLRNAERIGVPQILRDLYAKELIPARAANYESPVCIGCGCCEYDACDEGCGWLVTEGKRGVCSTKSCEAEHLPRWQAGDRALSPAAEERVRERGDEDEPEWQPGDEDDEDLDDMDDAA